MKKKIGSAVIAASLLFTAIPSSSLVFASSVQQQTIYSVQSNFAKEFGINVKSVSSPIVYDLNNDGDGEFIVTAKSSNDMGNFIGYIGVYSKNGKKIVTKNVEDDGVIGIARIKNSTYKNSLAIIRGGGSGGVSVEVAILKNGVLQSLLVTEANNRDEAIIKDSDKDGSDEIYGYQYYLAPETQVLNKADGIYDKFVYKWDSSKKKYTKLVYGQDGIREDQRKKVETITSQEALTLLNKARTTQLSIKTPMDLSSFKKKMESLFTYNYLYRLQSKGLAYTSTGLVVPNYLISDNYSSLVPEFNSKKKATFKLTADKQSATVTQTIQEDFEGEVYSTTYKATLLKTKYGWKVEGFSVN
ncbi:hypothetical protein [Paenibacillus sp. NPDC057934]|uniref:hypothetical protein n=1 Tax=Paenibacillus sp. NPDC057934 TaxID=3346282 RepID=UPI0036DC2660